jgi:hypothetical protein
VTSPVLLGRDEHLLADIDMTRLGYSFTERVATPHAGKLAWGRVWAI